MSKVFILNFAKQKVLSIVLSIVSYISNPFLRAIGTLRNKQNGMEPVKRHQRGNIIFF